MLFPVKWRAAELPTTMSNGLPPPVFCSASIWICCADIPFVLDPEVALAVLLDELVVELLLLLVCATAVAEGVDEETDDDDGGVVVEEKTEDDALVAVLEVVCPAEVPELVVFWAALRDLEVEEDLEDVCCAGDGILEAEVVDLLTVLGHNSATSWPLKTMPSKLLLGADTPEQASSISVDTVCNPLMQALEQDAPFVKSEFVHEGIVLS